MAKRTAGSSRYLDGFAPVEAHVGYGELGTGGSLGYEEKRVEVRGRAYRRALSTHPPAHVVFALGGRYSAFECQVALNDDVAPGQSHADFMVLADGRVVACAPRVAAGDPPRLLTADIAGAGRLELLVTTSRWAWSHAVWLDPKVHRLSGRAGANLFVDCLGRAEIARPAVPLRARRSIATLASAGYEHLLDDMLGSLAANGGCQDALLVVFLVGPDENCERVAAKYGAAVLRCRPLVRVNATIKSVMYSVAALVDADQFLCLDADMLVLGDLRPVFAALEALPERAILACRDGNGQHATTLADALRYAYDGNDSDLQRLLSSPEEARSPVVMNDGLFAGSRAALLALDGTIRAIPEAAAWTDERVDIAWRNQFIFNLALARLHCGYELDGRYNVQLFAEDVETRAGAGGVAAMWRGRPATVLHFCGTGRNKAAEVRGHYARVADPLVGAGHGDGYGEFLDVLKGWIGRHGLHVMTWSFYGTADACGARVADPGVMPLLGLLHYLVRSNGCVRVVESGTARGVSAACLASAVAHRDGARVVTFDPNVYEEREDLWEALPPRMRAAIEARGTGGVEGMTTAWEAGEQYDAALLDSIHAEEHVWAEFQAAARLVAPGGLILIHDARFVHGTVPAALRRIEAAGYGVVRLWTAESGVCEDDQLGLAVVENRKQAAG